MGGTQSQQGHSGQREQQRRLMEQFRLELSEAEQESTKQLFQTLANPSRNPSSKAKPKISPQDFAEHCNKFQLPTNFSNSLFQAYVKHRWFPVAPLMDELLFYKLVLELAHGSVEVKAEVLYQWLMESTMSPSISNDDFLALVTSVTEIAFLILRNTNKKEPISERFLEHMVYAFRTPKTARDFSSSTASILSLSLSSSPDELTYRSKRDIFHSIESLTTWLKSDGKPFSILVKLIAQKIFVHYNNTSLKLRYKVKDSTLQMINMAGDIEDSKVIPKWQIICRERSLLLPTLENSSRLLSVEDVWWLNSLVPPECRQEWRLLFSDTIDGASWSRFAANIEREGPTVVVIEDEEGYRFGGFAMASWNRNSAFIGTEANFLFTLAPHMEYFPPTGLNTNYQYYNHGVQTFPNGLGFGGQLRYFGLWIDASFEFGQCKAEPLSTTYNSPRMNKNPSGKFKVAHIEVWGLLRPVIDPLIEDPRDNKKSVLDKYKEDSVIMGYAGKQQHSDGYREKNDDSDDE